MLSYNEKNKLEVPEIYTCKSQNSVYDKGHFQEKWGKDNLLNAMGTTG